ncbi:MAG: hypothetical protein AAGA67_05375, partial [Cyanobacteria bacterium P01_F01_bin.153]
LRKKYLELRKGPERVHEKHLNFSLISLLRIINSNDFVYVELFRSDRPQFKDSISCPNPSLISKKPNVKGFKP